MSSFFQNPVRFLKGFPFVRNKVQYTIAHNYVCRFTCQRKIFNVSKSELYIIESEFGSVQPGFLNHLLSKVDANYLASFTRKRPRDKAIVTCPRSEIDDGMSFFYFGKLRGQSTAES